MGTNDATSLLKNDMSGSECAQKIVTSLQQGSKRKAALPQYWSLADWQQHWSVPSYTRENSCTGVAANDGALLAAALIKADGS